MEPQGSAQRLIPMTLLKHHPLPPTISLTPRLARRGDLGPRSWLTPGFGASTAYINLSPGLVCVFDTPHSAGLTHQEVGCTGLSVHQAWNAAADELVPRAVTDSGVEFLVRDPTIALGPSELPPGYEVDGHGAPAAAWLAHPKTFTVLHRHFESVMAPQHGLVYATRDDKELFVFDAPVEDVRAHLGTAAVMTYSVGFPLLLPGQPQ